MKRLFALLSLVLILSLLMGCGPVDDFDDSADGSESNSDDNSNALCSSIMLNDEFYFKPVSESSRVLERDYIKVSEIDDEYISDEDGLIYVDYTAPQFELGGIRTPSENDGILNRFPSDMLDSLASSLVSGDVAEKFSYHTAGATLRFCTNAKTITIKASTTKAYSSHTTEKRGTVGFDVYVGSGTSRTYTGGVGQMLVNVSMGEKVYLPGNTCEVVIHLPQMAGLRNFEIGFDDPNAMIASPTERSIDPIVFYGSGITQGMSSSRGGISYANIVCRMLNADCVNLGFYEGAHGEQIVADYIASIEKMSAFVMEYDCNSSIDELRENHYAFYKTVRDAHPDIPIVIMSDPIIPMRDSEDAAERVSIIRATCERAVAEGDSNIYFLDGRDIFPLNGDMVELYTGDAETLSDTGMQYLATCVYDVLDSAFTPNEEKNGVDRLPGLRDSFELDLSSKDSTIDTSSAVKIGELDSKYIESQKEGVTYISVSTPQLVLGGMEKPSDNGGEFFRVDTEMKDEFFENLLAPNYKEANLFARTAGTTLRFVTNADEIYLKAELRHDYFAGIDFSHRGSSGFDVYVGSGSNRVYCGEAGQSMTGKNIDEKITLPGGYVEVMIDFPTYSGVQSLSIGFSDKNASISAPTERTHEQIVFYGSSITQGCSAARSGLVYTNIVSRLLDTDCKNLGFAASARGEQVMADYIAGLDMSAFVLDYDYNSSVDELRENHYNFYKTVRDAHPDMPIVIMSRPVFKTRASSDELARISILMSTYNKAVADGDTNVYFIRGDEIFPLGEMADLYTVDFCHPNDTGFYYMAKACYEVLDEALNK